MMFRIIAASVMALLAGSLVERARADQAFVCEDGSLIQVKAGELERAMRTNACVAGYFGAQTAMVPLPARKPTLPAMRASQARQAEAGDAGSSRSDYRMVRIINAGDDASAWFHHTR